ncbi:MAG: polyphosphate:AMP phosphotransferase [Clostridiales bacterium]|nr:polyphosphate:AMP phosphotransferase [Clostridiales bacterium]
MVDKIIINEENEAGNLDETEIITDAKHDESIQGEIRADDILNENEEQTAEDTRTDNGSGESEISKKKLEKEEIKRQISEAQKKLGLLAQKVKEAKLPVIILFEGWGASGKGYLVSKLIEEIDPRGFKVYTIGPRSADERRFPMMKRYWEKIPEYGRMSFFVRSWYRDVTLSRFEEEIDKKEIDARFREILDFESQLADDGYLIIKFFLRLSKKDQRKRFEKLESNKATAWRVTKADWEHHRRYDDHLHAFNEMIDRTDRDYAPWVQIDSKDRRRAILTALNCTIDLVTGALAMRTSPKPQSKRALRLDETIIPNPIPKLAEVDLSPTIDGELYRKELKRLQERLFELHNWLYQTKTPMIIVYEGQDAAGKGGNIKRVTEGLDPRGYAVNPVAAPTAPELYRQYLWRFWITLPKDGHIAIYDRSWYGRVMVEKIEGFCTEEQWKRAYSEINHFEHSLRGWGAIIIKFWLQIDKDEQLVRFTDRQNTPEKQWKITEEDWRNRARWDDYEVSVNEMLRLTNTDFAPWHIIESNDKRYARIKTLRLLVAAIEREMAERR